MTIPIYNYSRDTGEFISIGKADPDPLDKDNYLIPRFATLKQPPKPPEQSSNRKLVFENDKWVLKIDNRGAEYWTPQGEFITITELGVDVPEDALDQEPDLRSFDVQKKDALKAVDRRHATILKNLTGNATIEERDTWQAKALAAQAISDGNETTIQRDMITTEASMSGIEVSDLVTTIITKSNAFMKMIGLAAGHRKATREAILSAPDVVTLSVILEEAETKAEELVTQYLETVGRDAG